MVRWKHLHARLELMFKSHHTETRQAMKEKLLNFIDTTDHYETARLFGLLPPDGKFLPTLYVRTLADKLSSDLYEAKAILLGRMGRHDNALEIYVYRLQDFVKAEE